MLKKIVLSFSIAVGFTMIGKAQCIEGNCHEEVGTFLFENGDKFKGQWRKGLPSGYGVYEFANGDVYKGAWKDGKMSGRGTYTYNNGDKYIGEWKEGLMNGRGHFYWNLPGDLMTNAKYEGFFKDGQPENINFEPVGTPAEPPSYK
ncbi:MAG: hypothetical protein GC178_07860 [Flavobacteriales bacterium]|nr:hypothetical protein [Flavobacteriales bacterium]